MKFITLFLLSFVCFAEESRDKIIVLDSGIGLDQLKENYICSDGAYSTIPILSVFDTNGHGTNVIGLIAEKINPKTHCIVSIKVWDESSPNNVKHYVKGLMLAQILRAKFINISLSGDTSFVTEWYEIKKLLRKGVIFAVAAGNGSVNLDKECSAFPACYKKIIPQSYQKQFNVVGALDVVESNYGIIVTAYIKGYKKGTPERTGTSQSTARFMGMLISKK